MACSTEAADTHKALKSGLLTCLDILSLIEGERDAEERSALTESLKTGCEVMSNLAQVLPLNGTEG